MIFLSPLFFFFSKFASDQFVFCGQTERSDIQTNTNSASAVDTLNYNLFLDRDMALSIVFQWSWDKNQWICEFLLKSIVDRRKTNILGYGLLSKFKGKTKCMQQLKQNKHWSMQIFFDFKSNESDKISELALFGGKLLTKLDVYSREINYAKNFFGKIVQEIFYGHYAQENMIDTIYFSGQPTKWPSILMKLLAPNKIKKLKKGEEILVKLSQELQIYVSKDILFYRTVYTVEKKSVKLFEIALINKDFDEEVKIGQFFHFAVEKIKPGKDKGVYWCL